MPKLHRPEYYEAIIQLRPDKQRLVEYVIKEIEKSKQCDISKIVEIKTGINIYVTSKRFAMALGKKMKKRFDGELKLSRQLYSQDRQTGKMLWRVTVLFRLKE